MRSREGAVRVAVRRWCTGGEVPCGWSGGRVEEGWGTAVVSRSLRLTGDITLRHGWTDRGTEGAMVIQAEKCHCPDTAVTRRHTHTYTHTRAHKDPGQSSLESLRVKKRLATVGKDEEITSSPFKKGD